MLLCFFTFCFVAFCGDPPNEIKNDPKFDIEDFLSRFREDSKDREIAIFDVTHFSYSTVPNTSFPVPFRIEFTLEAGEYQKKYLDFSVEEIKIDANKGLEFFNPGYFQSLKAKRKGDTRHYEATFQGEPKSMNPRNMEGVPYDLKVKPLDPAIIIKRDFLEFSVSAYTEYFDEGITILPLGFGEVGKSLWIETNLIAHSTEPKWKNVDYGNLMKDRTIEIRPFSLARYGFFGNRNTYIDIWGMEIYEKEFLLRLTHGWIPRGYSRKEYFEKTYLDITEEPEWDDPKRMKKVGAIAYFLVDEQLYDESSMEYVEKNIDSIGEIEKDFPIVFIISCRQTYSCPEETLELAKDRIGSFSDSPVFDLKPYIKPPNSSTRPKKCPRIDKNQWRINEGLLQLVKDNRRRKNDDYYQEEDMDDL